MACCGEYDSNLEFEEQPHFALNCIMDAREQVCYSAIHAMAKRYNILPSSTHKDALGEMIDYLQSDDGLTACIAGLHGDSFPTPLYYNSHSAQWTLQHNWMTPGLIGAEISYATQISGVSWPELNYPDLLETCNNLSQNNLVVFEDGSDPLMFQSYMTLEEADGTLIGPSYGGGIVESTAGFASALNSCVDPDCSYASVSESPQGAWQIDEMMLRVDGFFIIDNGIVFATLDRGYLKLSGAAVGTWDRFQGDEIYEIPAGNANFVAGGSAGDHAGFLTVQNSSPITATYTAGEWHFDAFDVEYVDPEYGIFTMTVDPSTWLED